MVSSQGPYKSDKAENENVLLQRCPSYQSFEHLQWCEWAVLVENIYRERFLITYDYLNWCKIRSVMDREGTENIFLKKAGKKEIMGSVEKLWRKIS